METSDPCLCWPSQAAADSVCPSQPGCWLWFWVTNTKLLLPEWVLPVLTQILRSSKIPPTLPWPGWLGCPSCSTPDHRLLLELLSWQFIPAELGNPRDVQNTGWLCTGRAGGLAGWEAAAG